MKFILKHLRIIAVIFLIVVILLGYLGYVLYRRSKIIIIPEDEFKVEVEDNSSLINIAEEWEG